MQFDFWHDKWQAGQIGFHLDEVRGGLKKHFPKLAPDSTVLVPLCGKSKDMLWLAKQGYAVTGVEFVEQAALEFFQENELEFNKQSENGNIIYTAEQLQLKIVVGDFFAFQQSGFDVLYDRAAMVALPEKQRRKYVEHCLSLLAPNGKILLVVLHYPQAAMVGPPFSIPHQQVKTLWGERMTLVERVNLLGVDRLFKDVELEYFEELNYLG